MSTEKPTKEKAAQTELIIDLDAPSNANVPAVVATSATSASANAGGLSYKNATPEEREKMDKVIASIDLTNPETLIALGKTQREKLATLADEILDSIQPDVKIAFAKALAALLDVLKANSLGEIKERITDGKLKRAFKGLWDAITPGDDDMGASQEMIGRFMQDLTKSRQTIEEMVDKLTEQNHILEQNNININRLGKQMTESAQEMRIERAGVAEFIERVKDGRITVLDDLKKKADQTGRADDLDKSQLAHQCWNNLQVVDADLLGSIAVYDMQVANLAFTKQANMQNRIQTSQTLTSTVAEWKTQLAVYGTVLTEEAAGKLINAAGQLTAKAVQANQDLFDTLVDTTLKNATMGNYKLRDIIDKQAKMAEKLETIGPQLEAQFKQLEDDKAALAQSSQHFRERAGKVFSDKGGVLTAQIKKPDYKL